MVESLTTNSLKKNHLNRLSSLASNRCQQCTDSSGNVLSTSAQSPCNICRFIKRNSPLYPEACAVSGHRSPGALEISETFIVDCLASLLQALSRLVLLGGVGRISAFQLFAISAFQEGHHPVTSANQQRLLQPRLRIDPIVQKPLGWDARDGTKGKS